MHTMPRGKGLLYQKDGAVRLVDGPFTEKRLHELLECETFQYIPFSLGPLARQREIWCDEEGMYRSEMNVAATTLYGDQVLGGRLYGAILIKHPDGDDSE